MSGRRDLALHGLVYIGVAILFRLSVYWFQSPLDYLFVGGLWTVPLILHGLRYFYRCGPGAGRRADEIERAIDAQRERMALDDDEELQIEERVSKRVSARRVLAAHGVASVSILAVYLPYSAACACHCSLDRRAYTADSCLVRADLSHCIRFASSSCTEGRRRGGRSR